MPPPAGWNASQQIRKLLAAMPASEAPSKAS
jgi:hypothetical protein